jgi:O-antigen/teichoic acid export membrane protein
MTAIRGDLAAVPRETSDMTDIRTAPESAADRVGQDPVDHGRAAISGAIWAAIGIGVSQLLRLAGSVVLAYLLFESAFGVMAMVNVFWTGMHMFSDLGVWRSVAQHERGNDPGYLNTAWTIQIIRGVALWFLCAILVWPYAAFYDEPLLVPYILVAGVTTIFDGFKSPSLMVLRRQVSLAAITKMTIGAQLASFATMITWAAISPSVWALVAGLVVSGAYPLLASHTWLRLYRPRLQWDRDAARELMRVGRWVFLSSALTFVTAQGDRLLLGKLVDQGELGLYSIALGLCSVVTLLANELLHNVVFPLLSRDQRDVGRVAEKFLRARGLLLRACSGTCVAIAIGAPLFFDVVYDERYADSGWQARWICLSLWFEIMAMGLELVPFALGNAWVSFVGGCVRLLGLPMAYYGFQWYSIPGLIAGFASANLLAKIVLASLFPRQRLAVLAQGLGYTCAGGAYLAVALLAVDAVHDAWGMAANVVATVLLAGVPLAWSGLHAGRSLMRGRRAARSAGEEG